MKNLFKSIDLFCKLASEVFNKKILSQQLDLKSKLIYCQKTLPFIGKGRGRRVYLLSSKKVLKIAVNELGIYHNTNEMLVLSNTQSNILPKLYEVSPDRIWIEVELVRPLKNWAEFQILSGIDYKDFAHLMNNWYRYDYQSSIVKEKYKDNQFLKNLKKIINSANLDPQEFVVYGNFGKNSNNELIVLDVGDIRDDID